MASALEATGNPSSVQPPAAPRAALVEEAREKVAALVGASPREVVFTSGGTEANALALSPALGDDAAGVGDRASVGAQRRPVCRASEEFPVTRHRRCRSRGAWGRAQHRARPLVSLMLANNETGVIQPVAQAAALVHAAGGLLHVDAVQGPGRIACDFKALGADLMTLSSHKIGGPQGVGALIVRDGLVLDALIKGGGQERGVRAGTENVAGNRRLRRGRRGRPPGPGREAARMQTLRDRARGRDQGRRARGLVFSAAEAARLPNTTLFSVQGMKAETAVIAFDLEGVAVSSGAACSSGKVAPSHVLAAMGEDTRAFPWA